MSARLLIGILISCSCSLPSIGKEQETPGTPDQPRVLAHYMPWYTSRPVSGEWGWHWTMGHFDPESIRPNGWREAASHDYPLIGLYDSGDHDVLECQVLQMKLAGIAGVIVDWYGIADHHDYAMVHRNTQALLPQLERAGLSFAVCYEDQSIGQMVEGGKIEESSAAGHAGEVFRWMEEHWFSLPFYLHHEDRPVLLTFGPQYLDPENWQSALGTFESNPWIFSLPHLAETYDADGSFGWPPVSGGEIVSPSAWRKNLEQLYGGSEREAPVVGVAFPGFHDIYEEARLHDSYGRIDSRNGSTFSETLDLALGSRLPLVQLATWNDYGEGTMIEPTRKQGYRYLEALQERLEPGFSPDDLRLPIKLLTLRKRYAEEAESQRELDEIATLIFSGKTEQAREALGKWKATSGKPETSGPADMAYQTRSNVLYRDEDPGNSYLKSRCRLDVYYPANANDFATVVWFHGGGLSKGNRTIPEALQNEGIAVVAANYRLSPGVESPVYIEDAAAAVAWTFNHIEEFGGSPDRIFVSGHSAGGYLASMVGLDKKYLASHNIDADRIAGLIPFSGHTITHFTVRKERGIDGKQPIVDELAPLFHVRKDAPPILLITGDRELELMARYEENAYFWRMMEVAGHSDTALRELEGFDHGKMPEPAFPLLLEFVRKKAVPSREATPRDRNQRSP